MRTPVALFIYNRPELTRRVFEQICIANPPRLFIVADGPEDDEKVQKTRKEVLMKWCVIERNYSKTHMGCGRRVSSGIDWAFTMTDELIILEDDTVPCPEFFTFCDDMLEQFRDDPKVMTIAGTCIPAIGGRERFVRNVGEIFCWGWATWARAWKLYDFNSDPMAVKIDTWDYQWGQCVRRNGYEVRSTRNLVTNIGCGVNASHCHDRNDPRANYPYGA